MSSSDQGALTSDRPRGPVLFAYDGTELSELAIEQAGRELASGRDAVVLCVWQPVDVGFLPTGDRSLDATDASEVCRAAEETAAHGATLASSAGFKTQSAAITAAPTWKGIVVVAKERDASLIVLGTHRRSGLAGHLLGSVASAVLEHAPCAVLIVPQRA